MKITLINPNIVSQKGDFFGTGIPYMPITLAYVAANLEQTGHEVFVIDAFGERPLLKQIQGNHIIQGLGINQILAHIPYDTDLIYIYASQVIQHKRVLDLINCIKEYNLLYLGSFEGEYMPFKDTPIIIVPNTQSVVSYSPKEVKQDFGDNVSILDFIPPEDLDTLPFPAWHLFPLENYWELGYAHAPYDKRYLPILSSWGCVCGCKFCIMPSVNKGKWACRSAKNVFNEIQYYITIYDVHEFEFEDLNPTLNKKRIEELCKLIIDAKLDIKLKFASGIKIETIDENTISLLKQAGCDYLSFSPESGSKDVLDLMQKSFDHRHAIHMLKLMNRLGITTQACFILGFPGETKEDLRFTRKYIYKLFRLGLDEMAVLVMTAMPGSQIHKELSLDYKDISKYTFSPTWQPNYKQLNRLRIKLYINSMLIKLIYHPLKIFKLRNTKMWMTMYRVLKIKLIKQKR